MTTIARLLTGDEMSAAERVSAPALSEPSSLGEAFARSADDVYRFILVRVGGDRHAADDLLQECCRCAAGHRRPPQNPSAWPGWFCGIARNLVRRHWRNRRRGRNQRSAHHAEIGLRWAESSGGDPSPEAALIEGETMRRLIWAVGEMNTKDQDVIVAFYFDGRSCTEIAAESYTTAKAVENRLRRARGRLRDILGASENVP